MSGRYLTLLSLVVFAVFSRLIPHPWNLTAVGSVALFSGAYLRPRILGFFVPVLAFFLSDLVLGFHETMVFTYGSLLISAFLGMEYMKRFGWLKMIGLSLASSLIFFILSNIGVWIMMDLYPKTYDGLLTCFLMAVPFFQGQVVGDLLYAGVLFGAYQWIAERARWTVPA